MELYRAKLKCDLSAAIMADSEEEASRILNDRLYSLICHLSRGQEMKWTTSVLKAVHKGIGKGVQSFGVALQEEPIEWRIFPRKSDVS